jgi:hypothetical protein
MRLIQVSTLVVAAALAVPAVAAFDQTGTGQARGQAQTPADADKKVAGGGIMVKGWMGLVDPGKGGTPNPLTVNDAKFESAANGFKVTTGPAIAYYNPANRAAGNYTVRATFVEPYMSLMAHAHPYGIMIGGNDLDTPNRSYLYCSAYGDGRFIVRGFGPAPFQMNARGEPNPAIAKAAAKGEMVKQEIAMSVMGDKVTCSVNGTVVGTYDKAALVTAGKLKSTDGIYGLRFGHNTEATVTGFGMTKN